MVPDDAPGDAVPPDSLTAELPTLPKGSAIENTIALVKESFFRDSGKWGRRKQVNSGVVKKAGGCESAGFTH